MGRFKFSFKGFAQLPMNRNIFIILLILVFFFIGFSYGGSLTIYTRPQIIFDGVWDVRLQLGSNSVDHDNLLDVTDSISPIQYTVPLESGVIPAGKLDSGVAWYSKDLTLPLEWRDKKIWWLNVPEGGWWLDWAVLRNSGKVDVTFQLSSFPQITVAGGIRSAWQVQGDTISYLEKGLKGGPIFEATGPTYFNKAEVRKTAGQENQYELLVAVESDDFVNGALVVKVLEKDLNNSINLLHEQEISSFWDTTFTIPLPNWSPLKATMVAVELADGSKNAIDGLAAACSLCQKVVSNINLAKSNKMAGGIRIFPNPIRNKVQFKIGSIFRRGIISIFDVQGKTIKRLPVKSGDFFWDGKDESGKIISSGLYLIHYNSMGGNLISRGLAIKIK